MIRQDHGTKEDDQPPMEMYTYASQDTLRSSSHSLIVCGHLNPDCVPQNTEMFKKPTYPQHSHPTLVHNSQIPEAQFQTSLSNCQLPKLHIDTSTTAYTFPHQNQNLSQRTNTCTQRMCYYILILVVVSVVCCIAVGPPVYMHLKKVWADRNDMNWSSHPRNPLEKVGYSTTSPFFFDL
jgi:hypothetical protein